ncbi:hypothetical protein CTI14_31220 [Methylobacterium radiotolerans]|nr:hypothetical protein CTI14_31220 [Methylobacterium radiotolerans]
MLVGEWNLSDRVGGLGRADGLRDDLVIGVVVAGGVVLHRRLFHRLLLRGADGGNRDGLDLLLLARLTPG